MSEISEPKVDDRPTLYIRDDYARQLPTDLDIGDTMEFTVKAEVTSISKNKYEDDEKEHISFDFKVNSLETGLNEEKVLVERAALGTTSSKTVRKLFDNSNIVITFKKED